MKALIAFIVVLFVVGIALVFTSCALANPAPVAPTAIPTAAPTVAKPEYPCTGYEGGQLYRLRVGESTKLSRDDGAITNVICLDETGETSKRTTLPPTYKPPVVPTSAPPTAAVVPTATPKPVANWQLPDPPGPGSLPTQLLPQIKYQEPPVNCASPNDPNQTCSTIEGQKTDGDFTLKRGYAIVMTGDLIVINYPGPFLFRPDTSTNHDLWVVVNNSAQDLAAMHMTAPYGSFRGYFHLDGAKWTPELVAHLRDLHIERFLIGPQPKPFTPTPVANCSSRNGCDDTSVRVIVWNGTGWTVASYGVYRELPLFWWIAKAP